MHHHRHQGRHSGLESVKAVGGGHILLVGEELLLKDSHWVPGASGGNEAAAGRCRPVVSWFCERVGSADGCLGAS